ncbi:PREDICTED: adhesion G-protein coupled receptor F2 [Miniopterus natalensis]|uniref:adhesion G-protein coupled receptor F2 n=1 Tax=Miniopterus natalensis TaxID=291302 RepID=UPI0007A72CF9|nr:PREDICTED: adhesion G-protein coupled receptor F2 [Miniopterus natalensis]
MTHTFLLYCLLFLLPTESCRTLCQAASKSKEKVTARPHGACDGVCVDNSHCSQPCPPDAPGNMGFLCRRKKWHKITDTCQTLTALNIFEEDFHTVPSVQGGKNISQYARTSETIADRLMQKCPKDLSCVLSNIQRSPRIPGNIAVIVQLLRNISAMLSTDVDEAKMQSYSIMANHILDSKSISNWTFIPEKNSSCVLLHSVNTFARNLVTNKHPIDISDVFIHTMCTTISGDSNGKNLTFSMRVNDTRVTGRVLISRDEVQKVRSPSQVVSIAFPTLGAILEASLLENVTVNGLVLSVILPKELKRISLIFEKIRNSEERRAQCVGWHSLESRWDQHACQMIQEDSQQAVCKCRPSKLFTSFSILMAPHTLRSPILTYITYIGLGVSICSLILCLSIEALVWSRVTKTEISFLRHLCIANVAATLLMADAWFIVASLLSGPRIHHNGCVAATFFVHFFYLAVFFWMLAMALLILYGILIVFHTLPKSVLVASLFSVGYGCPLVIAVITVAATEPGKGYLRPEACWLNWDMTKALLAFVVPALAIVVVNLITVTLVIVKTQRATIGSSMFQEVRAIVRISKNIAILTPLLGLTWGFGIAVVINDSSLVFHILFSLLNAFQGFFILVFGTILDPKIREALKDRVTSAKWASRISELNIRIDQEASNPVARAPALEVLIGLLGSVAWALADSNAETHSSRPPEVPERGEHLPHSSAPAVMHSRNGRAPRRNVLVPVFLPPGSTKKASQAVVLTEEGMTSERMAGPLSISGC